MRTALILLVACFGCASGTASAEIEQCGFLTTYASEIASELLMKTVVNKPSAGDLDRLIAEYERLRCESSSALPMTVLQILPSTPVISQPDSIADRLRSLKSYPRMLCSTATTRGASDPTPLLFEGKHKAQRIREQSKSDLLGALQNARQEIAVSGPSCDVVVEWAILELDSQFIRDSQYDWLMAELALRSLMELRVRHYLPKAYLTDVDLFFHLSGVFLAGEAYEYSLALAYLSLDLYTGFENADPLDLPTVQRSQIEERVLALTLIVGATH